MEEPVIENEEFDEEEDELLEYEETLTTGDVSSDEEDSCWRRQHWETPKEIEQNIDEMDKYKRKSSEISAKASVVEKKVDALLDKPPRRALKITSTPPKGDTPEGYEKMVHSRTGLIYYKKKIE